MFTNFIKVQEFIKKVHQFWKKGSPNLKKYINFENKSGFEKKFIDSEKHFHEILKK